MIVGKVNANRTIKGLDGLSAYEVAVKNGFIGSEDEWLHSLIGEKGDEGLSAYEVAVNNGYIGTEQEWIESLKGEPGEKGNPGEDGKDYIITESDKQEIVEITKEGLELSDYAKQTDVDSLKETITTKEQESINRDYALAIRETATGENIHITDSSGLKMLGFDLIGKSEQVRTNGYQLFPEDRLAEGTANGLTFSKTIINGEAHYKIKGTAASTLNVTILDELILSSSIPATPSGATVVLPKDKTIYFKMEGTNPTNLQVKYINNTYKSIFNSNSLLLLDDVITGFLSFVSGTEYNLDFTIMINEGTEPLPYEPFTGGAPSPNPNFPQEIKSVGDSGSVEVVSCGKNLSNVQQVEMVGEGFTNDLFNGKAINGTITISFDVEYTGTNTSCQFVLNDVSDVIFNVKNGKNECTFENVLKVKRIKIYTNTETIKISNIQLEYGTQATAYEPYREQTVTIPLDEPLRSLPNGVRGTYENGLIIRPIKKIILNGNENWILSDNGYFFVGGLGHKPDTTKGILSDSYRTFTTLKDIDYGIKTGGGESIQIKDADCATVQEFKEKLQANPITVQYELAEPIIEEVEPIELPSTYYPTTNISNDENAEMEVTYIADPKIYIDNKFTEMASAIVATAE